MPGNRYVNRSVQQNGFDHNNNRNQRMNGNNQDQMNPNHNFNNKWPRNKQRNVGTRQNPSIVQPGQQLNNHIFDAMDRKQDNMRNRNRDVPQNNFNPRPGNPKFNQQRDMNNNFNSPMQQNEVNNGQNRLNPLEYGDTHWKEPIVKQFKICSFFSKGSCRNGDSCSFIHDYNHQANTPTPMNGPTPRGPSPYIINTPPPAPVQEQEVQPTPLFQQPTTRPLEHLMMNPQQSVLFFAYNDNFIHFCDIQNQSLVNYRHYMIEGDIISYDMTNQYFVIITYNCYDACSVVTFINIQHSQQKPLMEKQSVKLVGGGFLQRDNSNQLCIVDAQGTISFYGVQASSPDNVTLAPLTQVTLPSAQASSLKCTPDHHSLIIASNNESEHNCTFTIFNANGEQYESTLETTIADWFLTTTANQQCCSILFSNELSNTIYLYYPEGHVISKPSMSFDINFIKGCFITFNNKTYFANIKYEDNSNTSELVIYSIQEELRSITMTNRYIIPNQFITCITAIDNVGFVLGTTEAQIELLSV